MTPDIADRLVAALQLFRGDFMEGCYDPWCAAEQERLRHRKLAALERLLGYHMERQEWLYAIERGRALLQVDPLREHVHRALMVCYYWMGDRPLALRQFDCCARILSDEIEIDPMPETVALRDEILGSGPDRGPGTDRPTALVGGTRPQAGWARMGLRAGSRGPEGP